MKTGSESRCIFVLSVLLVIAAKAGYGGTDTERWFLWREANARMATASKPEDFKKAAEAYYQLVSMGVRNGYVFYNLGTALLLANEPGSALGWLLRAERYLGSTPELRQNLRVASARASKNGDGGLPWYRALFFWHFGIGSAGRSLIACASFTCVWLALAFRSFGKGNIARNLLTVSIPLVVLFGSSVLVSWLQENKADALLHLDSHPELQTNAFVTVSSPAAPTDAKK